MARASLLDSLRAADMAPQLVSGLKEQLRTESDPQVLYKLVELAGLWLEQTPGLRATLSKPSKTEIEAKIKELTYGILEPTKKASDKQ